jgi:hypothetical protein
MLRDVPGQTPGVNAIYSIADIGMTAFSLFFMQSPSFLAHERRLQEGQGRSNCESLFGLTKTPGDNLNRGHCHVNFERRRGAGRAVVVSIMPDAGRRFHAAGH